MAHYGVPIDPRRTMIMVDYRETLRLRNLGNNIAQIATAIHSSRHSVAKVYLEPDCAYIHKELAQKGVNLTLLHSEYKVTCASIGRVPFQYTQFCEIYRTWVRKSKATIL